MSLIGIKITGLRFDSQKVIRATDTATRNVLSRQGAWIRSIARNSISKATKKRMRSAPGEPPVGHIGTLRKLLSFGYSPDTQSVVIGPDIVIAIAAKQNIPGPGLLEFGGRITQRRNVRKRRGRNRRSRRVVEETVTFTVKPRPFMGPALDKGLPALSAMWRDSIK